MPITEVLILRARLLLPGEAGEGHGTQQQEVAEAYLPAVVAVRHFRRTAAVGRVHVQQDDLSSAAQPVSSAESGLWQHRVAHHARPHRWNAQQRLPAGVCQTSCRDRTALALGA